MPHQTTPHRGKITGIACAVFCSVLLAGCSGGNYGQAQHIDEPIVDPNKPKPTQPTKPTDPDTPTDPDNPDNKEKQYQLNYLKYNLEETNFGVGDSVNLDDLWGVDSGLPLSYTVMPYASNYCKLTGEDNNILQTLAVGECDVLVSQSGNEEYRGLNVIETILIPIKCADDQVPITDMYGDVRDPATYTCVPNYLYINPIDDTVTGVVGQAFNLNLTGYYLYSRGQNLTVSMPYCDDLRLEYNGTSENQRYVRCTPTQAGDTRLTITNQDDGKVLFDQPVIIKEPTPIPPMPITKTGITWCGNATENNIDCNDQAKLGAYYGVPQDGLIQSGIAHDYRIIEQNNDTCILDKATGRMWEQKTDDGGLRDKTWNYYWYSTDASINDGNIGNPSKPEDSNRCGDTLPDGLCNSQAYINALNQSNYCGYSNWRLPTLSELYGLTDMDGTVPETDPIFNYFADIKEKSYIKFNFYLTQKRYGVDLNQATIQQDARLYKQSDAHILAVRHTQAAQPSPTPRFEVISGGTEVKDNFTKLVWQRCALGQTWDGITCNGQPEQLLWLEAFAQSTALGNGYRLPSVKELLSLAIPSTRNYKILVDETLFPNAKPNALGDYLSNVPSIAGLDSDDNEPYATVLVFNFSRGSTGYHRRTAKKSTPSAASVRPVRPFTAAELEEINE